MPASDAVLRNAPPRLLRELTRPWAPPRGALIVAGVSGGGDSVALFRLLVALAPGRGWTVEAATFDHRLRGAEGEADVRFVRRLAAELGVPCHAGAAGDAAPRGLSPEEAARSDRLAFLESVARERGAEAVALAHTLDDQAETVLMRMARGCGARGAGAMARRRGPFWRPLLSIGRAELRRFAAAAGLRWREDRTNLELVATRNRVRHLLLPALERACGPGAARALARSAELAREDEELLAGWAERALAEIVRERETGRVALDRRALAELPPAVARRALLRVLASLAGGRSRLTSRHAGALLALARAEGPGSRADLPRGLRAERRGGRLVIFGAAAPPGGVRD